MEERTTANARPSFADQDTDDDVDTEIQVTRTVDENAKGAPVGKPVSATDDDEVLIYSVSDPDADRPGRPDVTTLFGINERTGQITTKVALDSSSADGSQDTTGDTDDNEQTHTVTVNVVDPSGADASQDVDDHGQQRERRADV